MFLGVYWGVRVGRAARTTTRGERNDLSWTAVGLRAARLRVHAEEFRPREVPLNETAWLDREESSGAMAMSIEVNRLRPVR